MTITRVTSVGSKSEDESALEYFEKLAASEGLSEEEVLEAVAEYEKTLQEDSEPKSFEARKEMYKREKAREGFEAGVGGFKRS